MPLSGFCSEKRASVFLEKGKSGALTRRHIFFCLFFVVSDNIRNFAARKQKDLEL
jgi:hypothetical protein